MKENNVKRIIWPSYINNENKLSEGRKISINNSIKNPTIMEIYNALLELGFNPILENNKKYPKYWWKESEKGRIIIDIPKKYNKKKILIEISKIIKNKRKY